MTLVQKELKNAYIGSAPIKRATIRVNGVEKQVRPSGWHPGANTVLYLPLNTDYSDLSSYHRVYTSQVGTMSFSSYQGVNAARFDGGYLNYAITDCNFGEFTLLFWVGMENRRYGWETFGNLFNDSAGENISPLLSNQGKWGAMDSASNRFDVLSNISFSTGWHLYTIIHENGMCKIYLDSVEITTDTIHANLPDILGMDVGSRDDVYTSQSLLGWLNQLILENKARTVQEISDYYNQTKGDYGIS